MLDEIVMTKRFRIHDEKEVMRRAEEIGRLNGHDPDWSPESIYEAIEELELNGEGGPLANGYEIIDTIFNDTLVHETNMRRKFSDRHHAATLPDDEAQIIGELSADEYASLMRELDGLELAIAKGEDTPDGDARLKEIDQILDASPWVIDMDTCKVIRKPEHEDDSGLMPSL